MDISCPVCSGEMEDTRHVGVECFYDVHEIVPSATKKTFLQEIGEDGSYWGTTRRYSSGTKDKHTVITIDEHNSKIETAQIAIPPIRVIESSLYQVTCCKSCRADFLTVFGKWSKGGLRPRLDDDDDRNIPVRVNGSTVMMNEQEYRAHRGES